jgi:hypothetical protein
MPNEPSKTSTPARAEMLGERLGRSLARARQRVKSTGRPEGGRPESAASEQPKSDGPHVQRAEALVTRFGRGFTAYATVLRNRLRRAVARIREEAEDIAAEASHVRDTRAAAAPHEGQSAQRKGEPAA